jgi:hypothetical protein
MTEDVGMNQSIKMTLCVSKYADFGSVSNAEKLNIRRIDGKLYDRTEYEQFWIDRYVEMSKLDRERKEKPSPWTTTGSNGTTLSSSLPETIPNCRKDYIRAYKEIMNNPRSAVVTLVLSHQESIGAKIAEITTSSVTGLFLCDIFPNGQLGTILGKRASNYGAVLWKINGTEVRTQDEFNEAMNALDMSANFGIRLGE